MPLTLVITENLLPKEREGATMAGLTEAFMRLHGLAGNAFLTPNLIGHVQAVPQGRTYAGLLPAPIAIIEWTVPSFAFTAREIQTAYVREATAIVHKACGGKLPKESIWVNVRHAVDGMWSIAGRAMTNAELGAAVANG